jgi:hypothetical protein
MPAEFGFLEDRHAVPQHLEPSAFGWDQAHVSVRKSHADLGCQTGSPRFVVSDDAVLDRDIHAILLTVEWCGGDARAAHRRSPTSTV